MTESSPRPAAADGSLRATSDALMAALAELHALETRKRDLSPDDPEFLDLAERVDAVARSILEQGERQERLAQQAADGAIDATTPIVEIDPKLAVPVILERWRSAERRLETATPGSEDARVAAAEAEAYREAYQRVWRAHHDRPSPSGESGGGSSE